MSMTQARLPATVRVVASCVAILALVGCQTGMRDPVVDQRTSVGTSRPVAMQTQVTLERRPCYGRCPTYVLSIAGDGSVVFDGRANVDSSRRVTSRVSPDSVASLVRLMEGRKFLTLPDRYAYGVPGCEPYYTDAPLVITSLSSGDRTKRVEHDQGCSGAPASLISMENRIDEIAQSWRWINGRPPD